jgi:hypothetical protein
MQEVPDVAQPVRVTDREHHRQSDDFGTGLEVPEGCALGHLKGLGGEVNPLKEFALTTPMRQNLKSGSYRAWRRRLRVLADRREVYK